MEIKIFVAADEDGRATERLLDELSGDPSTPADLVAKCENLYGAVLDAVPGVVLQVMRIKKAHAMPLTVVDGFPVISGSLPTIDDLRRFIAEGVTQAGSFVENVDSAVSFTTDRRMHISMLVKDLEASVRFYEVFFGQPPSKRREDYAKFEVAEPPLVISFIPAPHLETVPGGAASHIGVNHLGVQVKNSDAVMQMKSRFIKAGFIADEEFETPCCYAVQTKIWVGDPDGTRWEVYVVTSDSSAEGCGADCVCYQEIAPSVALSTLG